MEVARQLGIGVKGIDFQPYGVRNADEALLITISRSIPPITKADGAPIGHGRPGRIGARLQNGWTERYGFDFVARAVAHLDLAEREAAEAKRRG